MKYSIVILLVGMLTVGLVTGVSKETDLFDKPIQATPTEKYMIVRGIGKGSTNGWGTQWLEFQVYGSNIQTREEAIDIISEFPMGSGQFLILPYYDIVR